MIPDLLTALFVGFFASYALFVTIEPPISHPVLTEVALGALSALFWFAAEWFHRLKDRTLTSNVIAVHCAFAPMLFASPFLGSVRDASYTLLSLSVLSTAAGIYFARYRRTVALVLTIVPGFFVLLEVSARLFGI